MSEAVNASELPRLALPGTRRGRTPSETLNLVQPFLRAAGITRVGVVTGLDVIPIPVVMVARPLSQSVSVTQGKGSTLDEAKVSGVMEAIEHFHAETVSGHLRLATETELAGERAVDTGQLPGRHPLYNPNRRILWQRGVGLESGEPVWVPFDLVHLDLRTDGTMGVPFFVPTSNGLASGNSLVEALVHALYELIERHATAEFYERSSEEQERRRMVNTSIDDEHCVWLLAVLAKSGVDATLWEMTNELGVATFLCDIFGPFESGRQVSSARGFGSHSEAAVAVARALCEAVQSRLTTVAGARDDIPSTSSFERETAIAMKLLERHPRAQRIPQRLFRSVPSRKFATFSEELEWLVAKLTTKGFPEPVMVNLSKPGWPIAVVRVIAPGLRFERTESMSPNAKPHGPRPGNGGLSK